MPEHSHFNRLASFLMGWVVVACAAGLSPDALAAGKAAPQHSASSRQAKSPAQVKPDLSGRKRVGKASV